ncbi:MAG: septum formation initiator family protein [Actinobacteria bacterium]|nr:septum formation initiator family protein [Actinomycetota bacterium]
MTAKLSNPAVRVGIVALVALVIALSLAVPLRSFVRQSDDNAALAAEVAAKERSIAELQADVERWRDDAFVEEQARSRLNYVYPGETAYVVVDADGDTPGKLPTKAAAEQQSGSWYERFWTSVEQSR